MVRTKADSASGAYRKAVAATAPRKSLGASRSAANGNGSGSSDAGTPGKGKYAGGNPVCPRPTPDWQKSIGDFFGGPSRKPEKENQVPHLEEDDDDEGAGGSGISRKSRPLIVEDEDDE